MKQPIIFHLLVLFFALSSSLQAGTKEELVRLQEDVIKLQNQFRIFEKTLNENTTSMKSLIEQLNDQVAKSNMLLNNVSIALEKQNSGGSSVKDEILPEIQTLSIKLDEMTTSLSALARQVSEMKVRSQPINQAVPSNLSGEEIFKKADQDFVMGDFNMAIQGFNAYLSMSPSGEHAATAQLKLGTSFYYTKQYAPAIEAFTRIINNATDSEQIAGALYRRAQSLRELNKPDEAAADFKNLIKRYPESPEAKLALDDLQKLGVR